jgi:hypothetical protein
MTTATQELAERLAKVDAFVESWRRQPEDDARDRNLRHWREECGKLHSRVRTLTHVLQSVHSWGEARCPCHNEQPNPCPLCGASVENLEGCKSAENTFPPNLLREIRQALRA